MQEIPVSKNTFINSPWEVSRRTDFVTCEIVTSKRYYRAKDFKRDRKLKKNAVSEKFVIARGLNEDIAEHIVEAHNDFMHLS